MSELSLKNFVDIDIKAHAKSIVDSTRDTVVLFTPEGTASTVKTITSLTDSNMTYAANSITYAYLKQYFDNGGVKVIVYEDIDYSDLTAETIKNLSNNYICVVCASAIANKAACYTAIKTIATSLAADTSVYGINEKLLIAATNDMSDSSSVKNFIAKYSADTSNALGIEMTVAAYLSQINVRGVNTINDYAFTQEALTVYNSSTSSWNAFDGENITDANYTTLQTNNINVDVKLANAVRNCGGNCKDGTDIVNTYVRIILHQTLTDKLINLLTEKIKSSTGISKIYSVIAEELEKYLTCGYLTTDKVWTDNDYKVTRGLNTYTVINKGDALTNGYVIKVLPMTALTDEEKLAHKAPPIYIVIADQYSVRKITINGDVI